MASLVAVQGASWHPSWLRGLGGLHRLRERGEAERVEPLLRARVPARRRCEQRGAHGGRLAESPAQG
jgi:hypothetical protein